MTYTFQDFTAGAVLTAAQMDQVEANIRDHKHGLAGVLPIFVNSATAADTTLTLADLGRVLFVQGTKTVSIAPNSLSNGWFAAVFNVGSLSSDLVTIVPGSGSLIDRLSQVQLGPQQGCLILAHTAGTGLNLSTIGRPTGVIAQNAQNANYTLALVDVGRHIYHNIASNNLFTIPANSGNNSVQFPIGTAISFVNANSAGNMYIVCSDTMRKVTSGATDTGTRTIAMNGMASALKVSSNAWVINGTGLS